MCWLLWLTVAMQCFSPASTDCQITKQKGNVHSSTAVEYHKVRFSYLRGTVRCGNLVQSLFFTLCADCIAVNYFREVAIAFGYRNYVSWDQLRAVTCSQEFILCTFLQKVACLRVVVKIESSIHQVCGFQVLILVCFRPIAFSRFAYYR